MRNVLAFVLTVCLLATTTAPALAEDFEPDYIEGTITVEGTGEDSSASRAYRKAKLRARAELIRVIKGYFADIREGLDDQGGEEQYFETITSQAEGFLVGSVVQPMSEATKEKTGDKTLVYVKATAPIMQGDSFAKIAEAYKQASPPKPEEQVDLETLEEEVKEEMAEEGETPEEKPASKETAKDTAPTGVIIDATKTGFKAGAFIRLIDRKGRVIYDVHTLSEDKLGQGGMVGYASSVDEAKLLTERLGENEPKVITARSAKGRKNSDIVLEYEDAAYMLRLNGVNNALNQGNVVVVFKP